ncbi:hypothetical protein ACJMK2_004735 [Sinanodonta woodiana]|uniref:Uncharacterized protein n=1 Tax=Sinanodonta woodiana TaxID=1069815 RepID=A0ABD3VMX8_SINWO
MSRLEYYGKFEMHESTILLNYEAHLKDTMAMSDTKYRDQQVANVNRVLFKMCPAFCNPECLIKTEAIKDYFHSLPSILADNTKINYIKSLLIFLSYCSQTSIVRIRYTKLIDSLPFIKDCLHCIRAGCAKRSTRIMAERRAAQFRGERTTYHITDILNSVNVLKKKYLKYREDKKIMHLKLKSLNTYFVALIS